MTRNDTAIRAFLDKWEPQLRDAFLEAFQAVSDRVSIRALSEQLKNGDVEGALKVVGLSDRDFVHVKVTIGAAYQNYGVGISKQIPAARDEVGAIIKTIFDPMGARARNWVERRSSTLVTEITRDGRNSIRNAIAAGMYSGKSVEAIARDLVGTVDRRTGKRTGGIIGLTSGQEEWQRRYAGELASADPATLRKALSRGLRDKKFDRYVEAALKGGTALPADIQSKMLIAYRNNSLMYRAKTIAGNETRRAMAAGQRESWQQAIDADQIDEEDIRRTWVTARDERVRHTHRMIPGMNAKGVGWNQPFKTPTGDSMGAPHDTDPMCRCHELIKLVYTRVM